MTGTDNQVFQSKRFDQVRHHGESPPQGVAVGAGCNAGTRPQYHDMGRTNAAAPQRNEVFLCNIVSHNSPDLDSLSFLDRDFQFCFESVQEPVYVFLGLQIRRCRQLAGLTIRLGFTAVACVVRAVDPGPFAPANSLGLLSI